MVDAETHKLLAIFGDGNEHSFFEACNLGRILFKKNNRQVWNLFKRKLLEYGLLKRMYKSWSPHLDFYKLSEKGDECFRAVQINRIQRGRHTDDVIRHFRHFNRQKTGKYGIQGMEERISEESASLREKYPDLYTPINE